MIRLCLEFQNSELITSYSFNFYEATNNQNHKIVKSLRCLFQGRLRVALSDHNKRWSASYRSTGPAEPPGSADSGCRFWPEAAAGALAGNTVTRLAAVLPGCTGSRDRAAETRLETRTLPDPRAPAGPPRIPPLDQSHLQAAASPGGQTPDPAGP